MWVKKLRFKRDCFDKNAEFVMLMKRHITLKMFLIFSYLVNQQKKFLNLIGWNSFSLICALQVHNCVNL